jgi:hypothetical protein
MAAHWVAVGWMCGGVRGGVDGAPVITEVKPTYCKQCGSLQMHWPDIAKAMEEMIDVAPSGVKPMFRQAIDEIRELRKAAWPYAGEVGEKDKDVLICPWMLRGRAGDKCLKCGDGPCKIVGDRSRPSAPYPMTYTFRDENCDDLYRDAMRYRKLRSNIDPEHRQIIDQLFDGRSKP